MKVYFDTNVLIAALREDHIHHAGSFAAFQKVIAGKVEGLVTAQGLAEVYSVVTRAPFAAPVHPGEAWAMIDESILPAFTILAIKVEDYLAAIAACAGAGWRGGRVHDAVHIEAAKQAGCDLIYTYDVAHFRALAPNWAERIVTPPEL
jgi:predicted nucleic acid-binding protein